MEKRGNGRKENQTERETCLDLLDMARRGVRWWYQAYLKSKPSCHNHVQVWSYWCCYSAMGAATLTAKKKVIIFKFSLYVLNFMRQQSKHTAPLIESYEIQREQFWTPDLADFMIFIVLVESQIFMFHLGTLLFANHVVILGPRSSSDWENNAK